LRASELCDLQWSQVELATGRLHVRRAKNGSPSKRLKRQQPERKEKYRERQCQANRKQHYKLSKPSARHDVQRQRNECDLLPA